MALPKASMSVAMFLTCPFDGGADDEVDMCARSMSSSEVAAGVSFEFGSGSGAPTAMTARLSVSTFGHIRTRGICPALTSSQSRGCGKQHSVFLYLQSHFGPHAQTAAGRPGRRFLM